MDKLDKIRQNTILIISSICLVGSYEIKNIGQSTLGVRIAVFVVSLLLGTVIGGLIIDLISSQGIVRRLLLKQQYIEGYWILDEFTSAGDYIGPCLVLIEFDGKSSKFQVSAYGLKQNKVYFSVSRDVYLRDSDLTYINFFSSGYGGGNVIGIAVGNFYRYGIDSIPQSYEGKTFFLNSESSQGFVLNRAIGRRITAKIVAKYKTEHCEEWIQHYLLDFSRQSSS
jgi:hypothetical protein